MVKLDKDEDEGFFVAFMIFATLLHLHLSDLERVVRHG